MTDASGGNGGPDIELTWTFEAPREEVWREWTEPERFADWYGGPTTPIPLETSSMDVREGGRWTAVMRRPEGREIHWDGEYIEVEEPETPRLHGLRPARRDVYDTLHGRPHRDRADRTEMLFQQSGGHMPAEATSARPEGWTGFFDRMAERLAAAESAAATVFKQLRNEQEETNGEGSS